MTGYLPGMRAAAVLQSAVGYRVKVVDMRVSLKRLNQQVAAAPGDIHLGVASGSWTVLRDLGADPEQVIEDGGHDPRIFDGPENFLSHAALGRLYQHCAERTNCPHFGLLVGEKASVSSQRDNPSRTASMRECGLSSGSASAASCSFTSSSRTQDSRLMRFS
ncbi:MAG: AraC family transcriptional regulator ligand-binding domain-containing protein [Microvirga sp.]